MSEEEKKSLLGALELVANSFEHEMLISTAAKSTVPGLLGMVAASLEQAIPLVAGPDPLNAERYIHLAGS